ncbi:MAG: tRNA 5-methoxyuridine(34)/uridine 5-oxyacetic acid(34) synthase CmoB [Gammaproteobacteria bacterium]|jgi:tRNA (mo5U34)-methyltransferase|nr:tRNA 5-methoxyuridine(34)/uridine 5-oxyacetic acid(34) synthase CmoB [Pseudomonadales bacterium]|tara:strand:+ start:2113 stop:3084 length:972 start_codon:yes stop_codon:yes gene_type:complete
MGINLEVFFEFTKNSNLEQFHPQLRHVLQQHYELKNHGRSIEWDRALESMPQIECADYSFTDDSVCIVKPEHLALDSMEYKQHLKAFMPWRKGPWNLLGVEIQTEWHSDWKWQRIEPHISPLEGRQVLDIGTGNGYFLFRMLGAGASLALGIDPTRIFLYQFHAAQRLLPANGAYLLPLRSEHLPAFGCFDTVFCLGVLYHRRSPIDHIQELMSYLRPGGELVLETLVVPGDINTILVPPERYAKMANVWFLPSTEALENMLRKVGLENVRTVDVSQTTTAEQRATEWMTFHSLADFLDPNDPSRSIEGHPAPLRATLVATKR